MVGSDLVAAVLVEDDQEDRHDDDDADHDDGVQDGVKETAADRGGVLSEGRVNPAETNRWVSCGRSFWGAMAGRQTYSCWSLFSE